MDATSERRIIHLVANGRSADGTSDRLNFGGITRGWLKCGYLFLQTASLEHVDEGESTLLNHVMPLVMWGRFALNGINIVTKAEGVKLLRSTACIQVKKGNGGGNTGLDDFVIEGITVHQGACHGFLAPTDCTGEVNTPLSRIRLPVEPIWIIVRVGLMVRNHLYTFMSAIVRLPTIWE